jgi:hypothetical protein
MCQHDAGIEEHGAALMPVYRKPNFRPRLAKRNPGRAPGNFEAQIPVTPGQVALDVLRDRLGRLWSGRLGFRRCSIARSEMAPLRTPESLETLGDKRVPLNSS